MSTFLIFGASGPVGRFLLPRLLAQQAHVCAVSRTPPRDHATPQLQWCKGDLYDPALSVPGGADVIVSLGPLDVFSLWLERQPAAGTRRVIVLSSMSAQSKHASSDPAEREIAERLVAAEQRVARTALARDIAWTVLRPTLVYGDGRDRSLAPIARFAQRWHILPIPLGACGLRQPVHADDLAGAVDAAVDCSAAAGKVYALGGGEQLRFDDLLRRLRAELSGIVVPLPVPRWALRIAQRLRAGNALISGAALQRLREPLIADNRAARHDFGYAPRAFVAGDVLPQNSRAPAHE